MNALTERRYYKVPEAAKLLGVSKSWLYAQARAGRLRVVRIGRLCRVDWRDLEAFFESAKTGGNTP